MPCIDSLLEDTEPLSTAAELRQRMAELETERREKAEAERRKLDAAHAAELKRFVEAQLTERDLELMRDRVARAVEHGQYEVEVMRFSAEVLTDRGRAVNNGDPAWPETLQGPAADCYAVFLARARPRGFRLYARVVNFPGGMPGDVALFLSWA